MNRIGLSVFILLIGLLKFKKNQGQLPRDFELDDLLYNTLVIFQMMMFTCMYDSIIVWPKLVPDKTYLLKLQGDVFHRIAELHMKLSQRLSSLEINDLQKIVKNAWEDLYPQHFLDYFEQPFENFGLFEDLTQVRSTGLINYKPEDVELDDLKKLMASEKVTK